jgi:plasmid stability protein
MIQIRNVPDALHRKLKVRAAEAGLSLSDYLLDELRRLGELPTDEEIRERLARLPPVDMKESAADIIRGLRDADDRR